MAQNFINKLNFYRASLKALLEKLHEKDIVNLYILFCFFDS